MLDKEIDEAEEYVINTTKKKHSEQAETPMVDNIDNYSPSSSKKNFIASIFKGKKVDKEEKKAKINDNDMSIDIDSDNTYVEELEDTAELIAFEPALENDELTFENDSNEEKSNETDEEVMMLALGYDAKRNREAEQKAYDSLNFSDTETQGFSNTDFNVTKTSVIDKVAGEEVRKDINLRDNDNSKAILQSLKSKRKSLKLRLTGVFLLSFLLLAFEILSQLFSWNINPVICIIIEFVLVIGLTAFAYDRIISGFKQLIKFKFDCDVITLFSFLYSLIYTSVILLTIMDKSFDASQIKYFNLPYAFCIIISLVSALVYNKGELYSYRVASSKKVKKALIFTENDTIKEVGETLIKKPGMNIIEVKETNDISEFMTTNESRTSKKNILNILIPFYLVISLVIIVILSLRGSNLYTVISLSYLTYAMTAPTITFFSFSLPLYMIIRKSYDNGSAVIGEASTEKYDNVGVVAFNDIDVFPSNKIKLKSINIFNSNKFERVIYYISSVFSKVGGPLDEVFKSATLDSIVSNDVEVISVAEKGLEAIVDGFRIVIGQPDYMKAQCFETIQDEEDMEFAKSTNKRVMYIACDDEVIAKFYIQYISSKEFNRTITYLRKENIGVIIKTADPCIDNELLGINRLLSDNNDVKIIRMIPDIEPMETISALNTGIITTGSIKSLIKTMSSSKHIASTYTVNIIVKIVAAVLGTIFMTYII
ncbi:MAG: hypothetical protein K6E24_04245, partial [bacterium]|nr:hypothetical protein [bacterium]